MRGAVLSLALAASAAATPAYAQTRDQLANIALNGIIQGSVATIAAHLRGTPIKKPALSGLVAGVASGVVKYHVVRDEDLALPGRVATELLSSMTVNAVRDKPLLSDLGIDIGPLRVERSCETTCKAALTWSPLDVYHTARLLAAGYRPNARWSLAAGTLVFEGRLDSTVLGTTYGNTLVIDRNRIRAVGGTRSCELFNLVRAHEHGHMLTHIQASAGAELLSASLPKSVRVARAIERAHISAEGILSEAALLPLRLDSRQSLEREIYTAAKGGRYRC